MAWRVFGAELLRSMASVVILLNVVEYAWDRLVVAGAEGGPLATGGILRARRSSFRRIHVTEGCVAMKWMQSGLCLAGLSVCMLGLVGCEAPQEVEDVVLEVEEAVEGAADWAADQATDALDAAKDAAGDAADAVQGAADAAVEAAGDAVENTGNALEGLLNDG